MGERAQKIKGVLKNKWFILGTLLVIAGVCVTLFFVLNNRDDGMRIKKVTDIEQRRASDYKESRLYLNKNGTFVVNVVWQGKQEFVGIGTYVKKNKTTYEFTYVDLARVIANGALERDEASIGVVFTYHVEKGELLVRDPRDKIYHFK